MYMSKRDFNPTPKCIGAEGINPTPKCIRAKRINPTPKCTGAKGTLIQLLNV